MTKADMPSMLARIPLTKLGANESLSVCAPDSGSDSESDSESDSGPAVRLAMRLAIEIGNLIGFYAALVSSFAIFSLSCKSLIIP